MLHNWTMATDANGPNVRIIMFDLRKAFDLIDHRILTDKLRSLNLPVGVVNWIMNFLTDPSFRRGACRSGVWFPLVSPRAKSLVSGYLVITSFHPSN